MPRVERAAVVTRGRPRTVDEAVVRLRAVAHLAGVELLFDAAEADKHGVPPRDGGAPELAVVLGGDGTMLRALGRFLGTGVPALGVNFGTMGFLTTLAADELEPGLARVFAGEYRPIELPTLELVLEGVRHVAVNDAVVTSSTLGRMIQLAHAIGGEELGVVPCDGLVCATPSGSTAYNLSNRGPVLVWGLEAMAVTFVAPHTLHERPLVVGPDTELVVENRSVAVRAAVLVDGAHVGELAPGDSATIRIGPERSLLATMTERGFFYRYGSVFGTK
jgi:NAD+ kinase